MADKAVVESFESIDAFARNSRESLRGQHIFTLPLWIKAWRETFKPNDELHICLIKREGRLLGVAPLSIDGRTASFVGDAEICDYLDFAVTQGDEKQFYDALLCDLRERSVTELDLRCLRPESTVLSHLSQAIRNHGGTYRVEPDGVSVEMELPDSWNEYLKSQSGKQRHEARRKLKRLHEKGEVSLLVLDDAAAASRHLESFIKMFRESRPDKEAFMGPRMETFFRLMISAIAEEGLLRFFFLKLNGLSVAAALCFDFEGTMYLYNSGYDPRYSSLSVGLLCKVLSIKYSIESGRKKYDFLKGAEPYKFQLGGKEVPLSRCRIVLS